MSSQEKAPTPRPAGTLQVSVASTSELFRHHARVSIHDSNMLPVQVDSRAREFSLPAGLYQVSAVLQDGFEHRQLVRVAPDRKIHVDLGAAEPPPQAIEVAPTLPGPVPMRQEVRKSAIGPWQSSRRAVTDSVGDVGAPMMPGVDAAEPRSPATGDDAPGAPADAVISLVAIEGARAEAIGHGRWRLDALPSTLAVPTATVASGDCRYTISLPIARSPGSSDSSACHLVVDTTTCGGRPDAWVAPERTVTRALQNMLTSGHLSSAAHIADDATEALRDKYADPAGAALGALILHRFGRLERRLDWLHNLAHSFPWLPDGKILLATTLMQQRRDSRQAHALALSSAGHRILYTESFSLLLDLLRRWRGPEAGQPAHQQALSLLASQASFVDWSSICLSISTPGNEHV